MRSASEPGLGITVTACAYSGERVSAQVRPGADVRRRPTKPPLCRSPGRAERRFRAGAGSARPGGNAGACRGCPRAQPSIGTDTRHCGCSLDTTEACSYSMPLLTPQPRSSVVRNDARQPRRTRPPGNGAKPSMTSSPASDVPRCRDAETASRRSYLHRLTAVDGWSTVWSTQDPIVVHGLVHTRTARCSSCTPPRESRAWRPTRASTRTALGSTLAMPDPSASDAHATPGIEVQPGPGTTVRRDNSSRGQPLPGRPMMTASGHGGHRAARR